MSIMTQDATASWDGHIHAPGTGWPWWAQGLGSAAWASLSEPWDRPSVACGGKCQSETSAAGTSTTGQPRAPLVEHPMEHPRTHRTACGGGGITGATGGGTMGGGSATVPGSSAALAAGADVDAAGGKACSMRRSIQHEQPAGTSCMPGGTRRAEQALTLGGSALGGSSTTISSTCTGLLTTCPLP